MYDTTSADRFVCSFTPTLLEVSSWLLQGISSFSPELVIMLILANKYVKYRFI